MHIFPRLGAFLKFKEDDSDEVYITDKANRQNNYNLMARIVGEFVNVAILRACPVEFLRFWREIQLYPGL